MDVFTQMELHEGALTPAEHAVYDIVKAHPDAVLGSTSNELARRYGVSQSAVSRFCKRLGFAGYGEFRLELHKSLTLQRFGERDGQDAPDYGECLNRLSLATRDALGNGVLDAFNERMAHARNVWCLGEGQSAIPARMLAGRLLEDSVCAHYIESGYQNETLHCMNDQDEAVVFSHKNPTFTSFLQTIQTLGTERRPHTTLVTLTAKHPDRRLFNSVILLPTWSSLDLPLYLEPQYSMLFFCMLLSA